jgi:3-oxoacyl-[acyl-carrier protein] reductase
VSSELEGKVALVTGGSRGIGHAVARTLAAAGAQVVLTARALDAAESAARAIDGVPVPVRGIALDVSDDDSVARGVASVIGDYARIAILVNNAGITSDNLLLRMKAEDWDRVLRTNLGGAFRLCRAVVPSMVKARYGRIVNVSSVVAHVGNPGQANYVASKAGLEGLTKSLARELASRNVTVNCVAPGFIETDMTRALAGEQVKKLVENVPLGRLGRVEDIAQAVVFLCSPGAAYITGATLHVNGGMFMD